MRFWPATSAASAFSASESSSLDTLSETRRFFRLRGGSSPDPSLLSAFAAVRKVGLVLAGPGL